MSHIVSIETQVRDEAAVQAACLRLQLPAASRGTFKLYSSTEEGLGVELPGWRYPVVANTNTGQLRFDNYEGRWGEQKHLDGFLQGYAVEKAKIEACRKGHTVTEQQMDNGAIKLTVAMAGGAL